METKDFINELMHLKDKIINEEYKSACFDIGLLVGVLTQHFPDIENLNKEKEKENE